MVRLANHMGACCLLGSRWVSLCSPHPGFHTQRCLGSSSTSHLFTVFSSAHPSLGPDYVWAFHRECYYTYSVRFDFVQVRDFVSHLSRGVIWYMWVFKRCEMTSKPKCDTVSHISNTHIYQITPLERCETKSNLDKIEPDTVPLIGSLSLSPNSVKFIIY